MPLLKEGPSPLRSNRRHSPQFQHLLEQASREALRKGNVWIWWVQLLIILYLLFNVRVMEGAHLLVEHALPWQLDSQLWLLLFSLMLQPLLWFWMGRLPSSRWYHAILVLALVWGCLWASVIYGLIKSEQPGRGALEPALAAMLLLLGLIALYPVSRVLYGFCLPILFGLASMMLIKTVISPLAFITGLLLLLVIIETGRRMLKSWFVLAVHREYEQERILKRLDAMAHQDPLTRIANRRYFDEASKAAIAQGAKVGGALTLILIDVDFFKGYNDHYGHQAGDECLLLVAECLTESIREPGDLVARYGGEEFVVLLPETDRREAVEVAERIRATLTARALPHAGSDVAPYLTVSQGVAQWQAGETLNMLLQRADEALYRVKEQGRNGYGVAP